MADEHDLDHVDNLDFLVHHIFDAILKSCQLRRFTPGQALIFPGGEPHGGSRSEFGGRPPVGVTWLGDVEPPRLPSFYGLREGAVGPGNVGHPRSPSSPNQTYASSRPDPPRPTSFPGYKLLPSPLLKTSCMNIVMPVTLCTFVL